MSSQPPRGIMVNKKTKSEKKPTMDDDPEEKTPHPFCSWTPRIYLGVISSFLCFLLLIVSAATNHWTVTTVDRETLHELAENNAELKSNLQKELIYRNCNRGLFSKCYDPVNFNPPFDEYSADRQCVYEYGFELWRREETKDYGQDYEVYIHLMRIIFSSVLFANACQLIAFSIALFMSMGEGNSTIVAGLFAFSAAIFSIAIVAIFIVVDGYEKNKIHHGSFEAHWVHTHPELAEHHSTTFGYSFYLGWVAAFLASVSCISFIVSYCIPFCKAKRVLGHSSSSSMA